MLSRIAAFLLLLAPSVTGCSSDDAIAPAPGPIDGRWKAVAFSCDGQALPFPTLTLQIERSSGTFTIELPGTCIATTKETYAYPTASSIAITPQSIECTPSAAACAPALAGATDCPKPPPTTLDFVISGDDLTVRRKSVGPPVDNCRVDGTLETKLTRF